MVYFLLLVSAWVAALALAVAAIAPKSAKFCARNERGDRQVTFQMRRTPIDWALRRPAA